MNEKRIILVGSAPQAVAAVKARTAEMAFIPLSMAIKAGGNDTSIPDMVIEQVGGLTVKGAICILLKWPLHINLLNNYI